MLLRQIYDEDLAQAAWLLGCQKTGEAIVIDPECPHFTHRLDFGRMSSSMRWLRILQRVQELSRPLHFTKAGPGKVHAFI